MLHDYDAFEVLPDGSLIWKAKIVGDEDAIRKLKIVAKNSTNEFRLMHISTKTVIATINAKSDSRTQENGVQASHPHPSH